VAQATITKGPALPRPERADRSCRSAHLAAYSKVSAVDHKAGPTCSLGIQLRRASGLAAQAQDHPADRPSGRRIKRTSGPPPLEDRTDPGLAVRLPAPYRPLRTPRPPVQRLPRPRRRHYLLQEARQTIHMRHALIRQRQAVIATSSVMANACAGLDRSSPYRPVQDMFHWVKYRRRDAVEESAYLVESQADEVWTALMPVPLFCSRFRMIRRNAAAAMDRVMWRYQAWYRRTW
jgi:hypothetical protein